MALASCRQGDDLVATLKSVDADVPPVEDVIVPPPDVAIEHPTDVGTMDTALPPPIDIASDPVLPPPVDSSPPPACDAMGPILPIRRVNGQNSEACGGQLAAHTFMYALCACEDLGLAAVLSTGSFDSSAADTSVTTAGAAVGVAGNYPPVGARIGGSLTVAGTSRTPAISGALEVQGDLRLAGSATFFQLYVKRDAWFVSRIGYLGPITIDRNLYLSPPATLTGLGPEPIIRGSRVNMSFTVGDPCGCAERLDVAAMETAGADPNDNAARGIDRAALSNVTTATNLSLHCGRFRFDSIGGSAPIQLTVTGRTAIFVDGNAALPDGFQLLMGSSDAEVDWFIRGNLSLNNAKIGDLAHPSATRIYVAGGDNDLVLAGGQIGANIYAPNTNVNLPTGIAGSVYGKNLNVVGGSFVFIAYDRAILGKGNKCDQPSACDKCHSCNGGLACKEGTCQACKEDDDCCAPLVCEQGSCQPLLR